MRKEKTFKVAFVRHGQSLANVENRFSGWLDIDLTTTGYYEAFMMGVKLNTLNIEFDVCYTSLLKRAIRTTWAILDGMNTFYTQIIKSIYLNERHYGELTGLNYEEGIIKFGKENVTSWLNDYDTSPPPINEYKFNRLYNKKQYKISKKNFPKTESLGDTLKRALEIWKKKIVPKLKTKNTIMVVAHSNILKVLIKYLDKDAMNKNELLPNALPLFYEFDENMKIKRKYTIK